MGAPPVIDCPFKPGETYRTKDNADFHVNEIYDGFIYGRICYPDSSRWVPALRAVDGNNLIPPEPEVQISPTVREAFRLAFLRAGGAEFTNIYYTLNEHIEAGCKAAIEQWRREQK
jgi:hypothetical protein